MDLRGLEILAVLGDSSTSGLEIIVVRFPKGLSKVTKEVVGGY